MRGRIAYVDGAYAARNQAAISIEDRGYQFADGIYEVIWLKDGRLIDEAAHLKRLHRSLAGLSIVAPVSDKTLQHIMRELIRRNRAQQDDWALYMQITRGVSVRNHLFPKMPVQPSLVMTLSRMKQPSAAEIAEGVAVVSQPDIRWARRDIKSIALLPNMLARQQAAESGAREAWLIDSVRQVVTEASTANAYIVKQGTLITHPADVNILGGVTRETVLKLARKAGVKISERPFALKEALAADEAFITSTTSAVLPVTQLDGKKIGGGKPGPVTLKLRDLYLKYVEQR